MLGSGGLQNSGQKHVSQVSRHGLRDSSVTPRGLQGGKCSLLDKTVLEESLARLIPVQQANPTSPYTLNHITKGKATMGHPQEPQPPVIGDPPRDPTGRPTGTHNTYAQRSICTPRVKCSARATPSPGRACRPNSPHHQSKVCLSIPHTPSATKGGEWVGDEPRPSL